MLYFIIGNIAFYVKEKITTEQLLDIGRMENAVALFGSFDENVKLIEKEFNVGIVNRGTQIKISGEPENVSLAGKAMQGLLQLANRGEQLNDQNVRYIMALVKEGNEEKVKDIGSDCVCITSKGRPVKAKTLGQKAYLEAIRKNNEIGADFFGMMDTTNNDIAAKLVAGMREKGRQSLAEFICETVADNEETEETFPDLQKQWEKAQAIQNSKWLVIPPEGAREARYIDENEIKKIIKIDPTE